jgi:radical SAM superfamily enzyme YgiQ (UPF0313 family)
LTPDWPHPAEHFKRTDGNDWVYYSCGDDSSDKGVISWMGEYYYPCLPYASNPLWEINYLADPEIMKAFAAWAQLFGDLYTSKNAGRPFNTQALVEKVMENNDNTLHDRATRFHEILGGQTSVLPPDTRHIDYEVIPVNICRGCLYQCKFCCVKSRQRFQVRSKSEISDQIAQLKAFYGDDFENYNGLFLGDHDALAAKEQLLLFSAAQASDAFGFNNRPQTPFLFLFGSVDSFLQSKNALFDALNLLAFYTYINIGLESVDDSTLDLIGKPLNESKVTEAYAKMLDINSAYENIEVTANFVIGEDLPEDHYHSLMDLLESQPATPLKKGVIYLSPLKNSPKKRELLPLVNRIKARSNLPVFVYLIQRL